MNLIYTSKKFIRTLTLASFVILPTTVYANSSVNLAFGKFTTQSSTYSHSTSPTSNKAEMATLAVTS
ncbi:hypothetical protein [uncultured Gammaproteobacteria bacterium]|jgi:hypothetical protein|nr:hypothetical protein [uncultured Gammaproteobacteria bacterium]